MRSAGSRASAPEGHATGGGIRRWVSHHPFVSLGLCSLPAFALLGLLQPPAGSPLLAALVTLWQTLGFGPHAAANLLARAAPDLPAWLDVGLVALLGALPYLVADRVLAEWRARSRAAPSHAAARERAPVAPDGSAAGGCGPDPLTEKTKGVR